MLERTNQKSELEPEIKPESKPNNTELNQFKFMLQLEITLQYEVCKHLVHIDLQALMSTSHSMRNNVINDFPMFFWKEKNEQDFPHLRQQIEYDANETWRDEYLTNYEWQYDRFSQDEKYIFSWVKANHIVALKKIDRKKIIKLLLNEKKDIHHYTMVCWAKKLGHQLVLDYFYECITQDETSFTKDTQKRTFLYWAIYLHMPVGEMKKYFNAGYKVNEPIRNGNMLPLHLAVSEGLYDHVKELIKRGPLLINQKLEHDKSTPLMLAARNGNKKVIKLLLKKNADITLRDHFERTVIYYAIEEDNLKLVKICIQKNRDLLNQKTKSQRTPLIKAAMRNKSSIIRYLLTQEGIQINETVDQKSALYWVARNGDVETMDFFLKKKPDAALASLDKEFCPVHEAAEAGHFNIVEMLLQYDARPLNYKCHHGFTLLTLSLANVLNKPENKVKFLSIVYFVLKQPDIDVSGVCHGYNRRDNFSHYNGQNSLHFAVNIGDVVLVQCLVNKAPALLFKSDDRFVMPIHLIGDRCHQAIEDMGFHYDSDHANNVIKWLKLKYDILMKYIFHFLDEKFALLQQNKSQYQSFSFFGCNAISGLVNELLGQLKKVKLDSALSTIDKFYTAVEVIAQYHNQLRDLMFEIPSTIDMKTDISIKSKQLMLTHLGNLIYALELNKTTFNCQIEGTKFRINKSFELVQDEESYEKASLLITSHKRHHEDNDSTKNYKRSRLQ